MGLELIEPIVVHKEKEGTVLVTKYYHLLLNDEGTKIFNKIKSGTTRMELTTVVSNENKAELERFIKLLIGLHIVRDRE